VADLVKDGDTGYVVPVGDIETLVLRLKWLAWDEELRTRLAENARSRVEEWSPEANVDAVAEALGQIRGGAV
jgi:glycosyltransferase involved in cell wall biosynthesis